MMRLRFCVRLLCVLLLACLSLVAQKDSPTKEFQLLWKAAKPLTPKESLEKASFLSEEQRSRLVKALLSEIQGPGDHPSDLQRLLNESLHFRILAMDLPWHKEQFFLVQGTGDSNCSPTGNCSIWMFRRDPDRFSVVLYGVGQVASLMPNPGNGDRDIVISMHGSAFFYALKVYRFRGGAYRRIGCYEENFRGLGPDGEYHDLEQPLITACKK